MSTLTEKSPRLENVWLSMLHPDYGLPNFDVPVSALDVFRSLPLRSLYVGGVVIEELRSFDRYRPDGDSNLVKYFATAFPNLEELDFSLHPMSLLILPEFYLKLPHLKSLCFNFDLFDRPVGPNLESIPRHRKSPFFKLEANFFGLSDEGGEPGIRRLDCLDAISFSNYLFSIWPNIHINPQVIGMDNGNRMVHRNMVELINKHLDALSLCNFNPLLKYEEVRVLNEESWAECRAGYGSDSEYDSD
ncbi:hypothetical protein RhiJN_03604 [Ceratobasidium sp. AG-Ba]|nr:hypothetical protein RhiJN_03604 [Ceratobasidium sp. AG-Ba]QRW04499.1 hypothetical protein RhiLY_03498 [Ceratobasidium sp. AG-Ba]